LADATPGVSFVGRLATYKYYNMDQVVAQALTTYKQITTKPVIELVENVNGSASNVTSSNAVTPPRPAASLEVAAVKNGNSNGNGNGNGNSASK